MGSRRHAPGWFVTLEGPDGAGKTTQAKRLADHLRSGGAEVTLTREPGGTPLGEQVRAVLLATHAAERSAEAEALLFNAARSQLVGDVIAPALERGEVVVCDRFSDSTLAYQGFGAGLDRDGLRTLAAWATHGLVPDLTLLFDLPVEAGLGRRARGAPSELSRFEQDPRHDVAFHQRVRAGFLELAAGEPGRWRTVDASRDADDVARDVRAIVDRELPSSEPMSAALRMTR